MLVNIEVIEKPELSTKASFLIENFTNEKDFKEALSIIFMISADYYLDPELEIADLRGFIDQANEKNKATLALFVSEDGLELEFLD